MNELRELCAKHECETDNKYFSEVEALYRLIWKHLLDGVMVYVPSAIYQAVAPLFFYEWQPYGNKVQNGMVPKLRLPKRPHSTTIETLKSYDQLDSMTRHAIPINCCPV